MKKILTLATVALAILASSADIVELSATPKNTNGGKVAHIEAISSVAAGTVTVYAETLWYTNGTDIVALPPITNYTYTLVYKDGATVITNVTAYPVDFTYIGTNYVSYATNETVVTNYKTNYVSKLALAITNTVDTLTCSSGSGAKSPSDAWVAPQSKIWWTGTAKGRVWAFIEK